MTQPRSLPAASRAALSGGGPVWTLVFTRIDVGAHPGFPWIDKSGAKRPDRGDSLAAHGPGQAIGLPASLTRGTTEAPGSRAARRAVAPATRSALEAGGAAPQALHRKGIASVGARPSTGKASSRTVIKGHCPKVKVGLWTFLTLSVSKVTIVSR